VRLRHGAPGGRLLATPATPGATVLRLPSFRIGRVLGVPLEVNVTWFLVFGVVTWTLATGYYPLQFPGRAMWVDGVLGVLTALLLFSSVVIHELGHSLVARREGIRVERVTLFMFGGVAQMSEEPRSARAELELAVAGPATSLVLAALAYALYRGLVAAGAPDVVLAPAITLAAVNTSVAVFNLSPGFPMDGGRVLRALLWWSTGDRLLATRFASRAGQVLGLTIAGLGVWSMAVTRSLTGGWPVLLGLFLFSLAGRAFRAQESRLRLAAMPATSVMVAPAPVLDAAAPVEEASRAVTGGLAPVAVVVNGGRAVGVVTAHSIADALTGASTSRPSVADAACEPPPGMLVDAGESVETVAARLAPGGPVALLVIRRRRVVGVITREAVGARLAKEGSRSRA
jgi:Zn-dependent protease/predicted transcriptional regulator